jgi:hypothetical protein
MILQIDTYLITSYSDARGASTVDFQFFQY